jgi:hypothetical protein
MDREVAEADREARVVGLLNGLLVDLGHRG